VDYNNIILNRSKVGGVGVSDFDFCYDSVISALERGDSGLPLS